MNNIKKKVLHKKKVFLKGKFKFIALLSAILSIFNTGIFLNSVYAENINSAYIYSTGDCGSLLIYRGITVKTSYVQYDNNGISYPVYCMDKTKLGAGENPYTVSIQSMVQDVGLWRVIVNGYPYKSIQELGVANKEEAFTATKQAVYCYIHGNNPDDYEPIGEAGQRTLNALKTIVANAQNSSETKLSSTLTINKNISDWKQDSIEKKYVSKIYSISAKSNVSSYKITLSKEGSSDLGGIKITDENNNEQTEFAANQKFKILVPIKNMTDKGAINIKVEAQVETKPILYGEAPDSGLQDYALTAATFENGTGSASDEYQKNETKIIILKKDQENGKVLEGVEFELLDENKQVVYSDLRTNEEGKIIIENLIPGNYYIKETKTIDGYEIYDQPIKVDIELNQEITVTINNNKEEKPQIDTTKKANKELKKLPVTGM